MSKERYLAFRKRIRELVANYMTSEGCSCCEKPIHENDRAVLCQALGMKKYDDGDGYDFWRYETGRDQKGKSK